MDQAINQNDELSLRYQQILEHAKIPDEYDRILAHVPETLDELDEFIHVREIVGRKCCITALLSMLIKSFQKVPANKEEQDEISKRLYTFLQEDGYDGS